MQSVHLMGDGYEPHVTQEEGKLTYSLPVDSGFISYDLPLRLAGTIWIFCFPMITDVPCSKLLRIPCSSVRR